MLRSHYKHLRVLLAIAMIAVVCLTVAVVILASNNGAGTGDSSTAHGRGDSATTEFRLPRTPASVAAPHCPELRFAPPPNGRRHDGEPDEGTRGIVAAQAPSTRYDGGPG